MGSVKLLNQKITPVILSGGAGSRLWPMSRDQQPKQFLPLIDGESMFHRTLARVTDVETFSPPIVITGYNFRHLVEQEFALLGCEGHIVLEPERRDSAAAIAAASAIAFENDPKSLLYVMASDHLVSDVDAFVATAREGLAAAIDGWIVTFGITPDKPATGFGYIQPGEEVIGQVRQVSQFIEKPLVESARDLISKGCLWNSGNFLFRADIMMEELQRYAPKIAAQSFLAVAKREKLESNSVKVEALEAAAFAECPATSIDFAVMERSQRMAVIAAKYGWSDIGSWDALWTVLPRNAEGNALSGAVTVMGTRDSLITSTGPHVAVLELENIAVIATSDAVLVAPRQVANALKPLVASLQNSPDTVKLTTQHSSSTHLWGREETLISAGNHVLRRIKVESGFDYETNVRDGMLCHVLVVSGEAIEGETLGRAALVAGQHVTWSGPFQGRLRCSGSQTLVLIETHLNLHSM
jgi:mannose-1-phosphate guanylyltransferase / mannose-6-phosphate isomerase